MRLTCFLLLFSSSFALGRSNKFVVNFDRDRLTVPGHFLQEDSFSFASYYGDHMVLQRAPNRPTVWGYSTKIGDVVNVTISEQATISVPVVSRPHSSKGVWVAHLQATPFGGPYIITAKSSLGTIQLKYVLFGDVWLCSGQSNMQFTLDMGLNASIEMNNSVNYPDIRIFTVKLTQSPTPQYDLLGIDQNWTAPNPDAVGHSPWSHVSAVCWLYGKYLYNHLKRPIGLIASSWGGTAIETWSSPEALAKCGMNNTDSYTLDGNSKLEIIPSAHSVLWNSMIHPFLNLTIYGVIWYQGEANAGNPSTYNCTFPAMIDDWRTKFHTGSEGGTSVNFPFGFVQLAPNRNNSSITTGFPDIRWHQTANYGYVPNDKMENVFMAVAMDLPDFSSPWTSIHPRDKQDVSQRLVVSGLAVAYNQTGSLFQGPYPEFFFISVWANTLTMYYGTHHAIDVRSKDGFEVCCSQNSSDCFEPGYTWIALPIESHDNESCTISYGKTCKSLNAVRYAWRESPCPFKQCAVYSVENQLPAPPFIASLSDSYTTSVKIKRVRHTGHVQNEE